MPLPTFSAFAHLVSAVSRPVRGHLAESNPPRLVGFAALAMAVLSGLPLTAQTMQFNGAIRTLAGGFSSPFGVAVDGTGDVFVADAGYSAVREIVAVDGIIPASPTIRTWSNGFNYPTGVAVDSSGNVFVADESNNNVQEMLAVNGSIPDSPTIRTLGSGFSSPSSVAVDASGNVFVGDTSNHSVKEMLAINGSIPTSPTIRTLGSGFTLPYGVVVDGSGNVFVCDYIDDSGDSEVKEILAASGYTTTNNLARGFFFPTGVAVDGNGNLFVSDQYITGISEIVAVNGSIPPLPTIKTINTLGAGFLWAGGVAVDGSGNLFVVDGGHNQLKEILAGGNMGPVNLGSASSFSASLYFTFDVFDTLDSIDVFTQGAAGLDYTDAGTGSCERGVNYAPGDLCTIDVTFKPTAPGPRYGAAQFLDYSDFSLAATGFVQGTGVGPQANFLPASQSTLGSGFNLPRVLAVDESGNVFVADWGNHAVKEMCAVNGRVPASPTIQTLGSGFGYPTGIAVDGRGNLWVADDYNSAVYEVTAGSGYSIVKTIGSGFYDPSGIAVDGSGNVFVADTLNNSVKEILAAGGYTTINTLGSGFNYPAGVAVDSSGNVFVADFRNSAVKEIVAVDGSIPASPTIRTLGSGFVGPIDVAVDGNGNVFVADFKSNTVNKIVAVNGSIPAAPSILTIGTGFSKPTGVAVDWSGNVFVSDSNNNAVKEIDYADPPSLSFASTPVGSTSSDSPQIVTVENVGNATLRAVAPGLTMPTEFKIVAGSGTPPDCTTTFVLAAGAACNLSIEFAPFAAGNPLSEALVLTDNSLNAGGPNYATQSIFLSGIGTEGSAALTSPTPGSTLLSPSVTFTWTTSTGASSYALWLGSTGVGSYNLYYSSGLTVTSVAVAHLPTNGSTVYARLITIINGVQLHNDYTYTAATQSALTTPTPGTTLTGPDVTFGWTAAAGATSYQLWLGTTGVGSDNVYYSGPLTVTSIGVVHIPTNGATVYARLITNYSGVQVSADYTYTATNTALTTPAPSAARLRVPT